MNWKLNVIILVLAVAAFATIGGLESLARASASSSIACYVGLATDIAPLIDVVDTPASSADCAAVAPPRRSTR